ncbi:hypothetical protein D1820_15440 [Phaeobacter sp. LSS9]|uniref:hypothetical protein n=1 Tax=unclassified Phaeobacter TaxID=2621772 RepID=UPI000E557263|nr:hypothetical protein [Phaeobacter sp. LSS9]AXT36258.1 hypothetical protein D1820_15440 [Phaeobacter sp. LSS9]
MSLSYRKTPICGMTSAASDKAFKKAEHKRARRALSACDLEIDDAPADKQFSNPWGAPNDGKQWINPKHFPKVMRK